MSLLKVTYNDLINEGKEIIENNPFYFTLHLLIKYYFVKQQDFYLLDFLKDITKTENEFKVFMVYIEFSIYIYNSQIKNKFINCDNEDMVYIIIAYVKNTYDTDKNVLKPFINTVTENDDEVIDKFNKVKAAYIFKKDTLEKFDILNEALICLEKAKELENESKKYSNRAIDILQGLKGKFIQTIFNEESTKLFIKNV
jgi:hypothetical protein